MKKLLALLLVLVMCLSLFAACGNGNTDGTGGNTDEDTTPTITIWQVNDDSDYYADYNAHPITLYIEEKFNIDLSFQLPASGGETDSFNLMLSTGDFTDVISLGSYASATAEQMYEDGLLYDLAPYIEQYMPNYKAYLDANPKYKAAITTEDGHIFGVVHASPVENETMWGGMLYRRDILETMTGGYVSFPSGNEEPTTIEDWEYMLNLYQQYFQAAGMAEYACLILPYNGVFQTGELVSGFGIGTPMHYVIDGEVLYGVQQQGYYNYLAKMAEWYEKGWIYQDFASRVNDVFYMPNTSLTYGAAAGIWYGGNWQLGEAMSMPEYGLYVDVQPLKTPLDTEHNITECHHMMNWTNFSTNTGMGVTTKCSESELISYLTAMDYFFSEEGSMVVSYGLPEEYAKDNATMVAAGLEAGLWALDESGNPVRAGAALTEDGSLINDIGDLQGTRFPGIKRLDLERQYQPEINKKAHETWTEYGRDWCYPAEIALTYDQNTTIQTYSTDVNDCVTQFTVQVITGQVELNETTWAEFQQDLKDCGIEEMKAVYTEAYNDFMAKMAG